MEVLHGPFFRDDLGSVLTGKTTSFTTPETLLPGEQYLWGVIGLSGGRSGTSTILQVVLHWRECDPAAFMAPELMSPANHATVSTLDPSLYWDYPGDCVPPNYFLDFSTDPTFASGNQGGILPSSDPSSRASEILVDCTRYYWRVAARSEDGSITGPASDTFTFRTNTGGCEVEPEHLIKTASRGGSGKTCVPYLKLDHCQVRCLRVVFPPQAGRWRMASANPVNPGLRM